MCSRWWTVPQAGQLLTLILLPTPASQPLPSGSQLTSSAWSAFCWSLGIKHITTTSYHPQSNRMVERMHRQLKVAMVAHHSSSFWPSELPWVLLCLRSIPLEASDIFLAELVYSMPASLPGQFLSTQKLPPPKFLHKLHHLIDPFVPPPLVHGSSSPSGKVHDCRHGNLVNLPLHSLG